MKNLKAVLLAAGDSGRIWPVEDKLFLKFRNIPLIQHSLNQLFSHGINDFYIVASRKNELRCRQIMEYNSKMKIKVVVQKNIRGIAGAVLSVRDEIRNHPVLIVGPTDIFENYLIKEFMLLLKQNPQGILVGKRLNSYAPLGYLSFNKDIVTGIMEKPPPEKIKSDIASIVFDYYSQGDSVIKAIEGVSSKGDDLYEKAKDSLISRGFVFKLITYTGYWGYLKYPWHVLDLTSYYLTGVKKNLNNANIHPSAVIVGEVFMEDSVRILENVKILGPAFIGRGSIVGQNCLIRESMIGQNSVMGFSSEIARSYIGNNCWFHSNYIGDSTVLDNCAFGSGAVVANYRLDGKIIKSDIEGIMKESGRTKLGVAVGRNCRIGINVSLMPGVKIGSNTFIGSSMIVDKDIKDDKFMQYKNGKVKIINNKIKLGQVSIENNRPYLKY